MKDVDPYEVGLVPHEGEFFKEGDHYYYYNCISNAEANELKKNNMISVNKATGEKSTCFEIRHVSNNKQELIIAKWRRK